MTKSIDKGNIPLKNYPGSITILRIITTLNHRKDALWAIITGITLFWMVELLKVRLGFHPLREPAKWANLVSTTSSNLIMFY